MTDDEFEELVERCDALLKGRVEYTRTDGDERFRGTVEALFEAHATDDFEREAERFARAAEDAMSDLGRTFDHLERVDWYVPDSAEARTLALAVEALEVDVALGTSYEWPDIPATIDPDEERALDDAMQSKRLAYATTEDSDILGFVVGFSDELVLVHHVDLDVFALNGYVAILRSEFLRLVSVEEEKELDEGDAHFAHAAARALGVEPVDPGAPPDSLASFLRWAGGVGLVGVYERDAPGRRYVGAVASVDDETLVLHGVDRAGEWTGDHTHALADVIRVDLLDGYLRALERIAGPPK